MRQLLFDKGFASGEVWRHVAEAHFGAFATHLIKVKGLDKATPKQIIDIFFQSLPSEFKEKEDAEDADNHSHSLDLSLCSFCLLPALHLVKKGMFNSLFEHGSSQTLFGLMWWYKKLAKKKEEKEEHSKVLEDREYDPQLYFKFEDPFILLQITACLPWKYSQLYFHRLATREFPAIIASTSDESKQESLINLYIQFLDVVERYLTKNHKVRSVWDPKRIHWKVIQAYRGRMEGVGKCVPLAARIWSVSEAKEQMFHIVSADLVADLSPTFEELRLAGTPEMRKVLHLKKMKEPVKKWKDEFQELVQCWWNNDLGEATRGYLRDSFNYTQRGQEDAPLVDDGMTWKDRKAFVAWVRGHLGCF